ncbi:hypothetical protein GQX74_002201 [Glossina fuscipes]|nr:hypothetical protein GQX74_002201 [Glossina fuscipes]
MKYWILTLIALEAITTFSGNNMRTLAKDWGSSLLELRTKCLEKESLSTAIFPVDDMVELFDSMLYLKSEQVPHDAKCFLRCWLKETKVTLDNFFINPKGFDDVDRFCEREAKVLAKNDECEFSFLLLKCERRAYVETK